MTDVRLIDANALKQRIIQDYRRQFFGSVLWNILDDMPSIDAATVVRCFECANRGDKRKCPMCFDESDGIDFYQVDNTDDDGFCHYGERKEDDHAAD